MLYKQHKIWYYNYRKIGKISRGTVRFACFLRLIKQRDHNLSTKGEFQ